MNLTNDELDHLEKLGSRFFNIKQSAIILEIDAEQLKEDLRDRNSAAYKKYYRGRFLSESTLREKLIDHANRGSSKAQEAVVKLIMQLRVDELE